MNNSDGSCICRRLVSLGLFDALQGVPGSGRYVVAIRSCMQRSACPSFDPTTGAAGAPTQRPDRRGGDRRSGLERRQNHQAWPTEREQRSGSERRSGGDRRGLTAGESYTHDQTLRNLKAWCADKCDGQYKLWLSDDADQSLRFRFELTSDRDRFMAMLRTFKGP